MFPIVFLLYAILTALASGVFSTNLEIDPHIEIFHLGPSLYSTISSLEIGNVQSCGGAGTFLEMRFEGYTNEGRCVVPGDGKTRIGMMEFTASDDIEQLGLRYIVTLDDGSDPQTLYDIPLPNSSVKGGETYWTKGDGAATPDMIGHTFIFQHQLYRVDTGALEICTEAVYDIVQP